MKTYQSLPWSATVATAMVASLSSFLMPIAAFSATTSQPADSVILDGPYADVEEKVAPQVMALHPFFRPSTPPRAGGPTGGPELKEGTQISPGDPVILPRPTFRPQQSVKLKGYIWPTKGVLTSGFGWRWGRMHQGIDIAGPVGTPIVAAESGKVTAAEWNQGGYGNLVEIQHPDGSLTRYAHNSRILVHKGQQVEKGQSIAAMGSTGRSTGPHLHFEIRLARKGVVNPMAYLPRKK